MNNPIRLIAILAVFLLAFAALAVASFGNLHASEPAVDSPHVFTHRVAPQTSGAAQQEGNVQDLTY